MRITKKQLLNAEEELIRRLDNPDPMILGFSYAKPQRKSLWPSPEKNNVFLLDLFSNKEMFLLLTTVQRYTAELLVRHFSLISLGSEASTVGASVGSLAYHLFIQGVTTLCMKETVTIPNTDFVCEADAGMLATHRNVAGPDNPSVIVEVGYCEGLLSLCQSAAACLGQGTNVQFVIATKAWKARENGTRQLLYLHFNRETLNVMGGEAVPDLAISFGTCGLDDSTIQWLRNHGTNNIQGFGLTDADDQPYPACNRLGMAQYQVDVPTNAVFFGAPIPVFAPAAFTIDLFRVQDIAARCDDPSLNCLICYGSLQ